MKRGLSPVGVFVAAAVFVGCGGESGSGDGGAAGDDTAGSAGASSAAGGASAAGGGSGPSAGSDTGGTGPASGGATISTDGNCGFTPCGGDVVGSWSLDEACYSEQAVLAAMEEGGPAECSGFYTGLDLHASGTLEFGADGTMTRHAVMTLDHEFALDADCMQGSYGFTPSTASCEMLAEYLRPTAESASCSYAGNACHCAVRTEESESVTEDYATSGSTLSDSSGPVEYCVLGNVLQIRDGSDDDAIVLTFRRQ